MPDIKKNLVLSADLDTSKIRNEVQKLQKELSSGFKIDNSALRDLRSELKGLAKGFADELKSQLSDVNVSRKGGGKAPAAPAAPGAPKQQGAPQNTRTFYDQQRDKEVSLRGHEKYSELTGKKYSGAKTLKRAEQAHQEREQAKQQAEEQKNIRKQLTQKRQQWLKSPRRTEASSEEVKQFLAQQPAAMEQQGDIQKKLQEDRRKELQSRTGGKTRGEFEATPEDIKKYKREQSSYAQKDVQEQKQIQTQEKKEKESIQEAYKLRQKLQKELLDDKEKREMGIVSRVGEAFENYLKGGSFDISPRKADQPGFRRQAEQAGMGGQLPPITPGVGRGGRGGRATRILGAGGAMAMRAAGAAAVGVGAVAGGATYARSAFETQRQQREELARRRFESVNLLSQNRIMESPLRQGARNRLSPAQAGAAKVSGFLGGLIKGAPFQGAEAAVAEEGRREGDVAVQQASPFLERMRRVQEAIPTRLQTMAGGNMTSQQLNEFQMMGANEFGFGVEDTNQRLQQLRSTMGGRAANQVLGGTMDIERRLGIGAQEQGQFMEMLRGAQQGGVTAERAMNQQRDMMEKAISSGLDASKTSKFLQTTTDFIQQNTGTGTVDADRIADSLSSLAGGFASKEGRKEITSADLRRARTTEQILTDESSTLTGMAGAGNIMGTMKAVEEAGVDVDATQFLGLSRMSRKLSPEKMREIMPRLGIEGEKADKLTEILSQQKQQSSMGRFFEMLGLGEKGILSLGAMERNQTTGEAAGMREGMTEKALTQIQKDRQQELTKSLEGIFGFSLGGEKGGLPKGAFQAEGFEVERQRAKEEAISFEEGFKGLPKLTSQFKEEVGKLVETVGKAKEAFEKIADLANTKNSKPQTNKEGEGEAEARAMRGLFQSGSIGRNY